MANIIKTPAALLRKHDNSPVLDGDAVAHSPGDHRQLELVSSIPDSDGLLTIREIRKVRPEDLGLFVRPATTTVVLSEAEAAVILPQLNTEPAPESQDFPPSP